MKNRTDQNKIDEKEALVLSYDVFLFYSHVVNRFYLMISIYLTHN